MDQADVGIGLIWFLSFLFSTTVHEAMHALAAWRLGDSTAYNGGQVSLIHIQELQSNALMSMAGLVIAWKVFPFVTAPLFQRAAPLGAPLRFVLVKSV